MINIQAIAINFKLDFLPIRILLTMLVVAGVVLIPRSVPLERWFWAAVAGGLLVSPHTFEYDASLLLAPILKMVCKEQTAKPIRWIAATTLIPLPYFMTLLPMPLSAGPALLIGVLFTAIAWPEWFNQRLVQGNAAPTLA